MKKTPYGFSPNGSVLMIATPDPKPIPAGSIPTPNDVLESLIRLEENPQEKARLQALLDTRAIMQSGRAGISKKPGHHIVSLDAEPDAEPIPSNPTMNYHARR